MGSFFGTDDWTNIDPVFGSSLQAFLAASGGGIYFVSGWRSNAQQASLYAQKPNLAAPPGKSNHEFGLAMDLGFVSDNARAWAHANAARFGLFFPMDYEPWHVEMIGRNRHSVHGQDFTDSAYPQPAPGMGTHPDDIMYDLHDPGTQMHNFVQILNGFLGGEDMSGVDTSGNAIPELPEPDMSVQAVASTMIEPGTEVV